MKRLIFIVFFTLWCMHLFPQSTGQTGSKKEGLQTKYDRNAVTVVLLDDNDKYSIDLKAGINGVVVPDKFDNNMLDTRVIKTTFEKNKVSKKLMEDGIPNQVVAKWFNRSSEGMFDMSVIHKRGLYNASDDEVKRASATKIGMAKIQDAGQTLLNHSYIIVLRAKDIKTMDEIYDAQDKARKAAASIAKTEFKPVTRSKNGWEGKIDAYLYQLDFNDSVLYDLYENYWIYDDDSPEVIKKKIARFENTSFPVKFISSCSVEGDGSQYNSGHMLAPKKQLSKEELFAKLINTGLDNIIVQIENSVQEFQVKMPLYAKWPLRAKIGKKEGLKMEQRFFVVEFEMDGSGKSVAKRKGVVRAKKVVDNRKVATGDMTDMSKFYQVAGRRLEPGMLMQQKNDLGAGLSLGYSAGVFGGPFAKLELNLAQMAGRAVDIKFTQVKLFAYAAYQPKSYTPTISNSELKEYDFSFLRYQIGLSKGFYFARNFSLVPFVSFGMEQAKSEDYLVKVLGFADDDYLNVLQFNYGVNLSINIKHNIQLVGGATYYNNIGNATDKDNEDQGVYTDYFSDRKPGSMTIDAGIRFEF